MADGLFGTNVTAPRLQQTALQPAGIPGSTYVRPEQREVGTNLDRLASALGGLNSALSGFAGRMEAKGKDPNSDENKLYKARLQQMNFEQLRKESASGSAMGNQIQQDTLDVLLSARAAETFQNEWLGYYNGGEFDRTNGNMQAEYEAMQSKYLEMLPSEISRGHFVQSNRAHFTAWQDANTKEVTEYQLGEVNTSIQSLMRLNDQNNAASGMSAPERAQSVFATATSSGEFLRLPRQARDEAIYALAAEYALKGDHEMVNALLTEQRTDENGNKLPALIANPAYTTKGQQLVRSAQSVWETAARENGFASYVEDGEHIRNGTFTRAMAEARKGTGIYSDKELSNMLDQSEGVRLRAEAEFAKDQAAYLQGVESRNQESKAVAQALSLMDTMGGKARIKDIEVLAETGEGTRKVPAETIIEQVVARKESGWKDLRIALVERDGMSAEDADRVVQGQKVQWYANARMQPPEWTDALNGIAQRATLENIIELGNVTPALIADAELYRTLMAQNPAYAGTVLTDPASKAFLEIYSNAVNRQMAPDKALSFAAAQVSQPESMKAKGLLLPEKAQQIAQQTLRDLGFDDDRATNYGFVVNRVTEMGMQGMTEKEIAAKIKTEIEGTTVNINGKLVQQTRDLPGDFPVLMEEQLKAAYEVFGESYGLDSWEDLSVVPMSGQSKWMIVDKRTEQPIGSVITPQSLDVERKKQGRLRDMAVLLQIKGGDAKRAEAKFWYDKKVTDDRAYIDMLRKKNNGVSSWLADYMEGVLTERTERDEYLRTLTPEKQQQELDDWLKHMKEMPTFGTPDLSGDGL